ncbi:alpha/beta hydrolase [Pseudomonas tructae]|uniref:Alpha/beta hydrolase n=1 Tax=Pseudomonas tructae TaxID=2518644 RepID=A0A411MKZ5_9PSED|nr:alpha/beta hydrolase [Pseudomonas tructae]QBF27504.1 alpha/beta hydrolase [Pseudomonas tructae]
MSVNPDIAAYLQLVNAGRASGKSQAMHVLSPEQARLEFDQSSLLMGMGGQGLGEVSAVHIPTRDGQRLDARLYRPSDCAAGLPVLLYFHGGGYVVGSLDSHDAICQGLAENTTCLVLSVAYRLAPQWRFPTACEDAEDAWRWLCSEAAALGGDPQRLAVAGDSVGGSLATLVAQSAAAHQQPLLQVLIYPVTDASQVRASIERYAQGYLLEKDTLAWFYQQYARTPADLHDPRFSPLLAALDGGQAPVLMVLAECDPLVDEGQAYAAALGEAGVTVDLQLYAGMTHDFLRMDALVDEAEEALQYIAQALRKAFGGL